MIAAGITVLIVYLITIVIEIFLSAFLLIATFKAIDPKLNKQELRLGFTIALKLHAITYGVIMLALIVGFLTVSSLVILIGGFTAAIVYLVLLIKWYEMDLGTLLLTFIVQWALGIVLGLLLSGLIAGLFAIAI
tara:strand:- start:651 stop:1052 length:402 start_codon:yes stop_codon:yes gene_type:complete